MLDGCLAHEHDQAARRVAERATCRTRVALRAGPDLLLHRVIDAFEVLGPQQLNDFTRAEIVVVRGRACCRTNAAIKAAVQFVVEPKVRLDVLEDLLQLFAFYRRRIRYGIANVFLDAGR